PTYLCRFAVRAPQKYTWLFSPPSMPDFGTYFPRSLPEPTPGSDTSDVSSCLTLLVVTESQPSVHRLRLSASPSLPPNLERTILPPSSFGFRPCTFPLHSRSSFRHTHSHTLHSRSRYCVSA